MAFVTTIARFSVFWRSGVHRRTPLRWIIMNYTYGEYGGRPVTVIAGLVLRKRYTRYVFVVTSTPLDCVSVMDAVFSWDRKCNTCYSCECGSPTDNLCGCHNCRLWNDSRAAHATSYENWDFSNLESSKYVLAIWNHTTPRNALLLLGGCHQAPSVRGHATTTSLWFDKFTPYVILLWLVISKCKRLGTLMFIGPCIILIVE